MIAKGIDGYNRNLGDGIFISQTRVNRRVPFKQVGQFLVGEAGTRSPRLNPSASKAAQFQAKQLFVPAGVLSQFVVRQNVGPTLQFCQVVKDDDRHLLQTSLRAARIPSPESTRMGFVNPNSIMLCGDLRYLLVRMGSGISNIGNESINRPEFNSPGHSRG